MRRFSMTFFSSGGFLSLHLSIFSSTDFRAIFVGFSPGHFRSAFFLQNENGLFRNFTPGILIPQCEVSYRIFFDLFSSLFRGIFVHVHTYLPIFCFRLFRFT